MRRLVAFLALGFAVMGCIGDVRESTTPRTAEEQLLVSAAAKRAIATVDSERFAGRKVFVDATRLECVDKGYVVSAFEQMVAQSRAVLVKREDAEVVIEVRAAALGCWDGKWLIWIPLADVIAPANAGRAAPERLELGYARREGWARIQAWAYDAKSGEYVAGWRDAWGYAYVGFTDDIYPETSIAQKVTARIE